MGSDRDGEAFFDAVGKRRTAKECCYGSDERENALTRERSVASEQSARRGSDQGFEQNLDREFDKR